MLDQHVVTHISAAPQFSARPANNGVSEQPQEDLGSRSGRDAPPACTASHQKLVVIWLMIWQSTARIPFL